MAVVGISEFMFGFAFLYEQTHANWANLKAAPILPSLRKEEQEGWDAHLPLNGTDFYYQFKLTDYLTGWNAAYIADGTYVDPYYRLAFHRRNNNRQHQRLRIHSKTNPNTYYVAPEFNDTDDFNAAFLARELTTRSRLIPISECDDVNDSKQHHITFQEGNPSWRQHSESKLHEQSFSGREMEKLYRESGSWAVVNKEFAIDLFERTARNVTEILRMEKRLSPVVQRQLDFGLAQATRDEILSRTSELLAVFLGVTLVLVGSAE